MIERVLVGVPSLGGTITLKLAAFILGLARTGTRRFEFVWAKGYAPIEYARNMLVGQFLASDAGRFWMIDDDMVPDSMLAGLLDVDADIVAPKMRVLFPAVPPRRPEMHVCATEEAGGMLRWITETNGLRSADAVGSGCVIIRRKVLEDERMHLDRMYRDHDGVLRTMGKAEAPTIFRTVIKPNGERVVGEDIDFCLRAKRLGYTVAVDLDRVVGHVKAVDLEDVAALAAGR